MNVKAILKTAFPYISAAAAVGGPLGTAAAGVAGKALGIENAPTDPDGLADAIGQAAVKDPEALMKLKTAELDFEARMKELGFDTVQKLEAIAAQDRASARQREISVRDSTPKILAYLVIGLVILTDGYMIVHGIPPSLDGVITGRVLATAENALMLVLGYYFGSSAAHAELIAQSPSKDSK